MALSQAQISAQIPDIRQFGPINLVVIQPTSFCNLNCDYCYLVSAQYFGVDHYSD